MSHLDAQANDMDQLKSYHRLITLEYLDLVGHRTTHLTHSLPEIYAGKPGEGGRIHNLRFSLEEQKPSFLS
jgi:hypothetical protein